MWEGCNSFQSNLYGDLWKPKQEEKTPDLDSGAELVQRELQIHTAQVNVLDY